MSSVPDVDPAAAAGTRARGDAWPPHIHSGRSVGRFHVAFAAAAVSALTAGCVLFGLRSLAVCGLAVAAALIGQAVLLLITHRRPPSPARRSEWLHAGLLGLLFSLTLPVTAEWHVPVVGGLLVILIGKGLLGGLGNYLWHPALVGWAIVLLLFGAEVSPPRYTFLARGHLLTGSTEAVGDSSDYCGFAISVPPPGVDAWSMPRPIDMLAGYYRKPAPATPDSPSVSLLGLFRDHLPPWSDTVWGHVGGGIGETCIPALALGGLLLVYRGYGRWRLPAAALGTVLLLAAIWPIFTDSGATQRHWPALSYVEDGLPVGVAIVLFHLTGGGLWLACLLALADPITTPLTRRGQCVFGVGLGVLTMLARCNPWSAGLAGGAYWAVLGMNTLVPLIDRLTARRVLGARPWRRGRPAS